MERIGVIGAGTMGHGIAHISAMAGYQTQLFDLNPSTLAAAVSKVERNLDKGVARGKVTEEQRATALANLSTCDSLEALAGCDMVVEAVPEILALKQELFGTLEGVCAAETIFATNTSSLSIARIADGLRHPERVIGTHFFNPVHIMALLELIRGEQTSDEVLARVIAYGSRVGKECIVVKDAPGFATSRLGVCLGMEAIRMVEQGVASPEDIDKAMVLGYRHPIGPLRLSDLVGIDVRMHIGEYLARELGNPAFEPPELMRKMVSEGRLGKKSGTGFYDWSE